MTNRKSKKLFPTTAKLFLFCLVIIGGFWTLLQIIDRSGQKDPARLVASGIDQAQVQRQKREKFIADIAPHAIYLHHKFGIFASIIIAQASLESDFGQSDLAKNYCNLFGVKGTNDRNSVKLKTKEYQNGQWVEINDYFRVYPDFTASMDDHANLLVNGVDWNRNLYQGVLSSPNYDEAAMALQQAGYATDPTYSKKLIKLIEEFNLIKYDQR